MNAGRTSSHLERLAAEGVAALLRPARVGSSVAIDPANDLCDILELLVPELLRQCHPEWVSESIDGFFFSVALKTDEMALELAGTCILISDQSVTPFSFSICLANSQKFRIFRIRLGEAGRGNLGISGPDCNSTAALVMLHGLEARLEGVKWVYDVAL